MQCIIYHWTLVLQAREVGLIPTTVMPEAAQNPPDDEFINRRADRCSNQNAGQARAHAFPDSGPRVRQYMHCALCVACSKSMHMVLHYCHQKVRPQLAEMHTCPKLPSGLNIVHCC